MFSVLTAHSEEVSAAAGFVFQEPIFSESTGLDVGQDVFHGFLGILGDDARTSGVVAVFSRVADGFTHLGHAAFIHEVDDQFHFMEGFEVSDFRLVTSFAEGFETVGDELANAAAEDCLFTEEVCFRFFLEGRLDDAGTGTTDAAGVSQSDVESFACSVLFDSEYVRNTAAFCESTANEVARAFRSDHEDVDCGRRNDLFEVDVEAVSKSKSAAVFQVRSDFICIDVSLFFVRNQDHRDICVFYSFRNGFNFKAGFFGFSDGFAAFIQADDATHGHGPGCHNR